MGFRISLNCEARFRAGSLVFDWTYMTTTCAVSASDIDPAGLYGQERIDRRGIRVLTALCLSLYLVVSLSRYSQYVSSGFDLGIFDQAVRGYAHFQAPISAVKAPGFNVLGDHFSPILALLAPLYWIWDNPCMLLIAQSVLVASSIPIVYRFGRRRDIGERQLLLITAVYGLSWPIETMINFDFHEIAFAVPLLAAAIDALDRGNYRRVLLCSLALLLVREDMGLVVATLGLVAVLPRRWRYRDLRLRLRSGATLRVGVALIVSGVLVYLLTTSVLLPMLAPSHHFAYWQYGSIGKNLPDALTRMLINPWHAMWAFVTPAPKALTALFLIGPLALIPLRSRYSVPAVVLLAERFFNDRSHLWEPLFHYNALPWLVLVLAYLDAGVRIGLLRSGPGRRAKATLLTWLALTEVLTTTTTADLEGRSLPSGATVHRLLSWDNSAVRASRAAVAFLPPNVCVEADDFLIPHLTGKDYTTMPDAPGIAADFIAVDLSREDVGPLQTAVADIEGPTPAAVLDGAMQAGFVRVFQQGSVVVVQAPDYRGPSAACHPLAAGRRLTPGRPASAG